MSYPNPWQYQGSAFDPSLAEDYVGFVYCIENRKTGRKYIGKKLFWAPKTKMVKGKKKRVRGESDWRTYYGSSTELQEDVAAGDPLDFRREILYLCTTKGELSYMEIREQILRDVLRSDDFYNSFIGCKIHAKHLPKSI